MKNYEKNIMYSHLKILYTKLEKYHYKKEKAFAYYTKKFEKDKYHLRVIKSKLITTISKITLEPLKTKND